MKIMYELSVEDNKQNKTIYFGVPNCEKELQEMYRLRYNIYTSRGYIDPKLFPSQQDIDDYDLSGKCDYFIAKVDEQIIGTVRLIKDQFLPTEKECFSFEEPSDIKSISRENRAEIGRLIVARNDNNKYLPRNIVMLFMIKCLADFGLNSGISGGYAFIKEKLDSKLKKLKIPVHTIDNYRQIYQQEGVLYNYFNQEGDKVIPIYFITDEIGKYIDDVLHNSRMFQKAEDTKYVLRSNLYNGFLKMLGII
ncbi:MAG: hypothetical protein A3B07_02705 [Candidatus Yonathbacteria bacterium RIFCSPLOWO2_01_FULL_43_27]|uniref:N-acyl amino acid synthase FeeM catalytic core domain-containing protein n=1 Tax=Candidatus Yonathbacteria bacterium RIFCSPLOWO2_01_FULL_43_27 TaxID=1802726 RepID=A0A1G2SCK1_9BACT|nr:MAG: hypothetical protein A3B07_02705 [Candidatus Yonathbacteria bacterium RIFCSPLOWO2_01_FULL_43_27]